MWNLFTRRASASAAPRLPAHRQGRPGSRTSSPPVTADAPSALDWYDVNATKFQNYLTDFHDTFQRPIWVTEWACQNFNNGPQCTASEVAEFLNQTQAFMDSTDWVERYAWYGVLRDLGGVNTDDAMMNSKGQITDLGKQYIGSEGPKTSGAPSGGLPGLPTNAAGMMRWRTAWNLLPVLLVACML